MFTKLPPRIVKGIDSSIENHPYQVFILIGSARAQCSGSIISERLILTAAHCIEGHRPEEVTVWYGKTYANKLGKGHRARKLAIHPNFSKMTMDSDAALIWVSLCQTTSTKNCKKTFN